MFNPSSFQPPRTPNLSAGFVASKFPPDVAHGVRDTKSSWDAFNFMTVGLAAPALAVASPGAVKYFFLEGGVGGEWLNVPYGSSGLQKLDVYHHGSSGARQVVVFVHGGAWSHGYRGMYSLLGRR